jgi:maintenance of morphology protein 1
MGSTSFSFEPTFTQGLIVGQLSIVILLVLVLRHLFFDSRAGRRLETPTYHPRLAEEEEEKPLKAAAASDAGDALRGAESAVWFNLLLRSVRGVAIPASLLGYTERVVLQVLDAYRSKLRDDLDGPAGDEVVRKRVEEIANRLRPASVLVSSKSPLHVHTLTVSTGPHQNSCRRPGHVISSFL